ncbi:hypothetical protein OTU49_010556 [Cherax quadricarinatus]|uniref:C2H2-type domain-containing protein n=1 Tax=Cherax quadricarinatus TaxID=27406 RepID=A0AAW0WIF2_CHEQU
MEHTEAPCQKHLYKHKTQCLCKPEEQCQENLCDPTNSSYKCNECSACFSRYTLLTAHQKKHREGPPYICDDCSHSFENEDDWLDHKEVGCTAKDVKRMQSQRLYYDVRWKNACNRVREEKRHKCHHCSKSFKSVATRNDHERNIHKGLRPHNCDECGKQFYRKFNLAVHKRKHSSDRPYECKICHKRFKASVNVKIHMEIHSDRKPYMCENCGKVFKTLTVLEGHRTIHTGEAKFMCTVCGKCYRYRASLFIHMRTHTGQRPFNCTHCSASFMVKSHLTEHLRIHTGERPFECEFCSARFSRSISLKKHLKSHIRAGLEINLDRAMYNAKIQAHITPRESCLVASDDLQMIPKVPHDIKDSKFVLKKKHDSIKSFKESIILYTDLAKEEEALLVTLTSIGDGSTCVHKINRLVTLSNRSQESIIKIKNSEEVSSISQDQEVLLMNSFENNERFHFADLPQVGNSQEDVDTLPVMCLPDTSCSRNATEEPVIPDHLSNYECYTEKASIDSQLCSEWIVPQNVINNAVPRSDAISDLCPTSVQQEDMQIYGMDSVRQESIITFSSATEIEYVDSEYSGKTTGTSLNNISFKNEEEILMDNKIKTILLNQDISIVSDINSGDGEKPSNTSQLLAQLDESQTAHAPHGNTTVRRHKNKRKPLRKCRYCDVSYRYVTLLEAHEAKHELQTKQSVISVSENESGKMSTGHRVPPSQQQHYLYQSTSQEDLPFKCEKCNSSFSFRSELRNHVKLHSRKYSFTCKKCHQAFQQEIFLVKHQCGRSFQNVLTTSHVGQSAQDIPEIAKKKSENELKFKCDKCEKEFFKEFIFKVHYRKHSGKRPFKCKDCKMMFISATHRRVHRRIHTGERPYICKRCNKAFRYRKKFLHHIKICQEVEVMETGSYRGNQNEMTNLKSSGNVSDIKVCETVAPPRNNFSLHRIKEEPKEEYHIKPELQKTEERCSIKMEEHVDIFDVSVIRHEKSLCVKQESSSGVHHLHDKETENVQTNRDITDELQICESSETVDDVHVEVPLEFQIQKKKFEGLLRCSHCPKVFRFQSTLNTHERSHTGEKPFGCSVCEKSFSKKSNMIIHMRVHTGERPFLCDHCGKYFTYKYSLNAHKRLHTQERPFICGVCGKSFRYEASRHVHLKRHAGDKAFKCDLCPKAFVTKIDMEDHRRRHTGEKPYRCEHCDRKFAVRHHLTEHRRLHTGEKPFKCQYCTITFAQPRSQKIHMQKHLKMLGQFL